jgi:hypothetical protein
MAHVSFKSDLGPRRYDLDWVRIGAFILLIFYHVGMYYVTWDFHVKSPHASSVEGLLLVATTAAACFMAYEVIRRIPFLQPLFGVGREANVPETRAAAESGTPAGSF